MTVPVGASTVKVARAAGKRGPSADVMVGDESEGACSVIDGWFVVNRAVVEMK